MRFVPLGLVLTLPLAAAAADPPAYKELYEKKAAFEKTEADRRDWLLKKFDETKREVGGRTAVPAAIRLKHQEVIADQKKAFEETGTLPGCDDMLLDLWAYMTALHKARAPLAKLYTAAMNKATAGGDVDLGRKLAKEKAAYDEGLPGRAGFQPKTTWVGQRVGPRGGVVDFSFWVGQSDGGAVKGQMWQKNGEVGMRMEGTLEGNYLHVKKVAMLKGDNRELQFAGFVMQDRLFLAVGGITAGGAPASGFVNLRLKKD